MATSPGHLQHAEVFFARRDGIDKTLKLLRYASRVWLALATNREGAKSDMIQRLQRFEASVGTSRKALRLGKFLQNVNALNQIPRGYSNKQHLRYLYLLAHGGEGLYYFLEQLVWLMKAGLTSSRRAKELRVIVAIAELAGYAGSLPLKMLEIRILLDMLREDPEKKTVRQKLYLKVMSAIQDVLDGILALSDITEGPRRILARPLPLALAGLFSGAISAQKNWLTC